MKIILIVEDDTVITASYKTVLEQEGYTVHTVINGPDALNLLQKEPADLILLDVMLPEGMNGFDVLMRLKQDEKTKHIPIIVMTNLESEKETALDYGANDYIIKAHTDVRQLVEKIRTILPTQP